MAVFTKGVVPWNSLDDNTRLPLTSELESGYPCGQADQQLFNFTTAYAWGQVHNAIVSSGLVVDQSNLTQLTVAIQNMIQEAINNMPPVSGRLIAVKQYTSSGVYTPSPGATAIIVTAVGGGGGGGGARATSVGYMAGAGGGGGGGAAKYMGPAPSSTVSFTVGSGGVGGSGGSGAGGSPGGTTELTGYVAGTGGGGAPTGFDEYESGSGLIQGGWASGGHGIGGNIFNSSGFQGLGTSLYYIDNLVSGAGGGSILGSGARASGGSSEDGKNASTFGGGGSGAVSGSSPSTAYNGGNGMGGVLIIEEYS